MSQTLWRLPEQVIWSMDLTVTLRLQISGTADSVQNLLHSPDTGTALQQQWVLDPG